MGWPPELRSSVLDLGDGFAWRWFVIVVRVLVSFETTVDCGSCVKRLWEVARGEEGLL